MNVSRPTLTRIYENARRTIAKALVEGKMIFIEGGNASFIGLFLALFSGITFAVN